METSLQQLLAEQCKRPQHLSIDRWFISDSPVPRAKLWGTQIDYQSREFRRHKHASRLEKWLHEDTAVAEQSTAPKEKFLEAKRLRFTLGDKSKRVTRSLAALNQKSRIQLTPAEWRQIVEDPDLEDQSS